MTNVERKVAIAKEKIRELRELLLEVSQDAVEEPIKNEGIFANYRCLQDIRGALRELSYGSDLNSGYSYTSKHVKIIKAAKAKERRDKKEEEHKKLAIEIKLQKDKFKKAMFSLEDVLNGNMGDAVSILNSGGLVKKISATVYQFKDNMGGDNSWDYNNMPSFLKVGPPNSSKLKDFLEMYSNGKIDVKYGQGAIKRTNRINITRFCGFLVDGVAHDEPPVGMVRMYIGFYYGSAENNSSSKEIKLTAKAINSLEYRCEIL